jgi:hypothetical protein
MDEKLIRLEEDLRRVPGVRNARIVGEDAPTEIHIVAGHDRPPKQLVRDVQSLAQAGFGLRIDHRIVSVVQLEDDEPAADATIDLANDEEPPPPPSERARRPLLERVVFATKGSAGWVKVALRWPDGEVTEGAGAAAGSREARARGAALATLNALEPVLTTKNSTLEVDQVVVHRIGQTDAVLVRAVLYDGAAPVPLVGSAVVHDDVATAAVRAMLHAINRKLS